MSKRCEETFGTAAGLVSHGNFYACNCTVSLILDGLMCLWSLAFAIEAHHAWILFVHWAIPTMSWAHSVVWPVEYPVLSPIYGDPVFGQPGFPLLSANIINMCTSRNLMCDALLVSTVAHIASSTFVERPVPCVIVAARGPGPATCLPRTRQPRHLLMTHSFLILGNTAGTAGLWMKH